MHAGDDHDAIRITFDATARREMGRYLPAQRFASARVAVAEIGRIRAKDPPAQDGRQMPQNFRVVPGMTEREG